MEPQPVTAYLGLGSNLGAREANLERSVHLLAAAPEVEVTRCSSVYETAPWGFVDQPHFLNCVLEIRTSSSPVDLLRLVKEIEDRLGRESTFRWGPRLIDIDILLYGDRIVQLDSPDLEVPHPRLEQRAFVLVPLLELGPGLVHPGLGESVARLAARVEGREGVVRWGPPLQLPAS